MCSFIVEPCPLHFTLEVLVCKLQFFDDLALFLFKIDYCLCICNFYTALFTCFHSLSVRRVESVMGFKVMIYDVLPSF